MAWAIPWSEDPSLVLGQGPVGFLGHRPGASSSQGSLTMHILFYGSWRNMSQDGTDTLVVPQVYDLWG